jgi:CheY-like chemotaxis protein
LFDLALLDLQMPVMDGYEAARQIRSRPETTQLKLIAMTAHAMVEERERCLAVGMNAHVSKPIDPDLLVTKIMRCIGVDAMSHAAGRTPTKIVANGPKDILPSAPLPETLPGIDMQAGLVRSMQDWRFYRDLLVQFHQHYADAATEISRLLELERGKDASFLAHTVKGAAGNLGANEVAATAAAIEDALRNGNTADMAQRLAAFASALAIVNVGLRPLNNETVQEKEAAAEVISVATPDSDAFRKTVHELKACLERNDTRAEMLLADMRSQFLDGEPPWARRAAQAIEALDYKAALEILRSAGTA